MDKELTIYDMQRKKQWTLEKEYSQSIKKSYVNLETKVIEYHYRQFSCRISILFVLYFFPPWNILELR